MGASGKGAFDGHLAVGDISGSAFVEFGTPEAAVGLLDPWNAQIVLLLHSHGPALTGQMLKAQLTSFLGGCDVLLGGPDGVADGPGDLPVGVMNGYNEGVRTGHSAAMKPAFHENCTFYGYFDGNF